MAAPWGITGRKPWNGCGCCPTGALGLSPSLLAVGEGSSLKHHFPRVWIGGFLRPTKGCSCPRPTGASQSFPCPAMLAILPLYMGCTHGAEDSKGSWNLVLHRQDTQDAPSQSPDPSSNSLKYHDTCLLDEEHFPLSCFCLHNQALCHPCMPHWPLTCSPVGFPYCQNPETYILCLIPLHSCPFSFSLLPGFYHACI